MTKKETTKSEAVKEAGTASQAEQKAAPARKPAAESKPKTSGEAPRAAKTSTSESAPREKKPAQSTGGAKAPLSHGVGRRKSSVARVWLRRGRGDLTVNDKDYKRYFTTELSQQAAAMPFAIYQQASKYDVTVNVNGGGYTAQADAVKLGFARALVEINPELRPLLREHGLLTVDSRVKERKKYGQRGARRKFQFVKR